jgi:hypothetical protein
MSRKHQRYGLDSYKRLGIGGTKPTLPMIIVLILILLQFGGDKFTGPVGDSHLAGFNGVDNGILFIIALFYLSCGNLCKSGC